MKSDLLWSQEESSILQQTKSTLTLNLQNKQSYGKPKNFLLPTEHQTTQNILQNMNKVITNPNAVGILQVANKKFKQADWVDAFDNLRKKMLEENKNSHNKRPQMTSYLRSLCLMNNRRPGIVKEIQFLSFPCLSKLDINGNKITNIEALQFMALPTLSHLYLYRNNITSFKPLSKCTFPQLSMLWLNDNLVSDLKTLPRMQNKVTRLWLQGKDFRVCSQDVSFVVKFASSLLKQGIHDHTTKMSQIGIGSQKRLYQRKLYPAIERQNTMATIKLNVKENDL